jgi:L-lactate dehydrogenase
MKVAIIGAGNVGSSLAYALLIKGGVSELSLIDVDFEKAYGQILDLSHGISFAENIELKAEGFEGVKNADVIVIAAGRGRKPNESRLDLTQANVSIYRNILKDVKKHYNGCIIIVVSNPVDILTYVTYKSMDISSKLVIGSGTVLDTSRFRHALSQRFRIDPRNIHAYIIGEHGDSSVPVWSMANVGHISLAQDHIGFSGITSHEEQEQIYQSVVQAGKEVIKRKGATYYAVALTVVKILETIFGNDNSILTISSYIKKFDALEDVCLSLPAVINRKGIRELLPISLTNDEEDKLGRSSEVIKSMIKEIE